MNARPVLGLLATLLSAACGSSVAVVGLPDLPEGWSVRQLVGTSLQDVWMVGMDASDHDHVFLHGAPGNLEPVAVPLPAANGWPAGVQVLPAGPGQLFLVDSSEGLQVRVVDATGGLEELELSTVFPELKERFALEGQLLALQGQAWLYATCKRYPVCVDARRLYRLEGRRFVEIEAPADPAAAPLALIGGQVWALKAEAEVITLSRRTASGWAPVLSPPVSLARLQDWRFQVAFTGPDDAWLGGAHWDGSSWSRRLLEPLPWDPNRIGALLATTPGAAERVELARSASGSLGIEARTVTAYGEGPPRPLAVEAPACTAPPGCALSSVSFLEDGALLFLVQGEAGHRNFVLSVRAEDL